MFDELHNILINGQEEVPPHVWEGVSSGLDRMSRRKTVALIWKRATVGLAVAAAVSAIFLVNRTVDDVYVEPDMTAINIVTEAYSGPEENELTATDMKAADLMAMAAGHVEKKSPEMPAAEPGPVPAEDEQVEQSQDKDMQKLPSDTKNGTESEAGIMAYEAIPAGSAADEPAQAEWVEAEERRSGDRSRVSFTLSGLTGTNGSYSFGSGGVVRRPTSAKAPLQTGVEEISDNTYGIPLSFGAGVKVGLTERWSVGVGVNYTLLTRRFHGTYMKVDNGTVTESYESDIRNSLHYIGIPLNIYYNIIAANRLNFYTYAGGTMEKCVGNDFNLMASGAVHKEKVAGLQWSANLGVGVEFMLGKHLGIYVDPSLRYYFKTGQPKSIRTEQPLMLGFELGLRTCF